MKKLVFSDINDTIKPENGKISDFCKETLKQITNEVEFVLVTGKNRQKTEEFARCYGGSRYIITSNGGEVFDTISRKTIYSEKIRKNALEDLFQLAKKFNLRFILNINDDFRFTTRVKYFDGSEKHFTTLDEICEKYDVVGGLITEIPDNLLPAIKQGIISTEGITIGNQGNNKGNNFIDFISEFANKGVAIKKLMKYLNADYKDTISIGNERNDIPMFSATCYNIAVANACDEIKSMVDEVIESVENDGVAKYLQKFVK